MVASNLNPWIHLTPMHPAESKERMSLRRDHRPIYIKKLSQRFEVWYTQHFLKPHFAHLGTNPLFVKPWNIEVFGPDVRVGDHCNIITTPDHKVRLNIWGKDAQSGSIEVGRYVFIGPGVRISAANKITIGDNCLIAAGVYITDSDWHGIYNRVALPEEYTPVTIGNNVWLGDGCTVIKGVTIGDNSVVGAKSVVTKDVPANVIVAGNPAKVVKELDSEQEFYTREQFFSNPNLERDVEQLDRIALKNNTLFGWIKSIFFPPKDI